MADQPRKFFLKVVKYKALGEIETLENQSDMILESFCS